MISWKDLYNVLTAVIPLYVAMILAYGSVRWWKIFTPDQCSGINRFVAVFAVPLLSFHFISTNDPFAMNLRFIAADTLQKMVMLLTLALWANYCGTLEWLITGFSLSTLPNTLVMGIPLLIAMYGQQSRGLMIQLLVLQCIIWYTVLLFLFEFRAARKLIMEQFPNTAASIVSFMVESDVVSLFDGQTEADIAEDGHLRVTIRKSTASRPSNLTGAEIYSLSSSRNPTPRDSNFSNFDTVSCAGCQVFPAKNSNYGPSLVYSVPGRPSNFEDTDSYASRASNPEITSSIRSKSKAIHDAKELHMFVWSSSGSPISDSGRGDLQIFGCDLAPSAQSGRSDHGSAKEIRMLVPDPPQHNGENKAVTNMGGENARVFDIEDDGGQRVFSGPNTKDRFPGTQMPAASVMTRLILIMVWRKLIRNPNAYSSLIGLLWSLIAFRWNIAMPKILDKSISILSDAGLGMAMFSLGLFMALQPKIIACGNSVAVFSMTVRFLAGPAVMAAASLAVGLRGTLLRIAIVQAALPQGIVPFVFAKEYNLHAVVLSTAVIFGMLIALPITVAYCIVVGL